MSIAMYLKVGVGLIVFCNIGKIEIMAQSADFCFVNVSISAPPAFPDFEKIFAKTLQRSQNNSFKITYLQWRDNITKPNSVLLNDIALGCILRQFGSISSLTAKQCNLTAGIICTEPLSSTAARVLTTQQAQYRTTYISQKPVTPPNIKDPTTTAVNEITDVNFTTANDSANNVTPTANPLLTSQSSIDWRYIIAGVIAGAVTTAVIAAVLVFCIRHLGEKRSTLQRQRSDQVHLSSTTDSESFHSLSRTVSTVSDDACSGHYDTIKVINHQQALVHGDFGESTTDMTIKTRPKRNKENNNNKKTKKNHNSRNSSNSSGGASQICFDNLGFDPDSCIHMNTEISSFKMARKVGHAAVDPSDDPHPPLYDSVTRTDPHPVDPLHLAVLALEPPQEFQDGSKIKATEVQNYGSRNTSKEVEKPCVEEVTQEASKCGDNDIKNSAGISAVRYVGPPSSDMISQVVLKPVSKTHSAHNNSLNGFSNGSYTGDDHINVALVQPSVRNLRQVFEIQNFKKVTNGQLTQNGKASLQGVLSTLPKKPNYAKSSKMDTIGNGLCAETPNGILSKPSATVTPFDRDVSIANGVFL